MTEETSLDYKALFEKADSSVKPTAGGICDVYVHINEVARFVVELKRVNVRFPDSENDHPVDQYENTPWQGSAKNTACTSLQTYTYMLGKGDLKYGFLSNYDHWCLLRRTCVAEDRSEVLEMTRFFKPEQDARLALAYFILTALEDEERTIEPGRMNEMTLAVIGTNNQSLEM